MNQWPRRISLMEKKEGQKSRGTIPLSRYPFLSFNKTTVLTIPLCTIKRMLFFFRLKTYCRQAHLKQQSSITLYFLPTKENKLPFSISVGNKQMEVFVVRQFCFPFMYIYTIYIYMYIYIYIYMYVCMYMLLFKIKNGKQKPRGGIFG